MNDRGVIRYKTTIDFVGAYCDTPLQQHAMQRHNPQRHHRRSIRLRGYDYSQAGAYFVTVCTQGRMCLFGEIVDGEMRLNDMGNIIRDEWMRTADIRSNVELDVFVVMPNHFHGIFILHSNCRGVLQYAPTKNIHMRYTSQGNENQTIRLCSPSQTIGAIIRGFKSASTKRINEMRGAHGAPVWQRNYYEHIIRDDDELDSIRQYIANNPLQWALDRENPLGAKDLSTLQRDEPWQI